ncbi:3-isopropylmalate dehydratase large subunit [Aneurinibacillus sp. REN35]|uniref:3-isopropylmalate dehydratase large subunit n=1 Tax=Aneurinibacillus sp. REN35 TaxID=3237286 RepID=UPI0035270192
MGKTLVQKVIERASGTPDVRPNQIVNVNIDLAMMHDSGGPRRIHKNLARLGRKVWNPDHVVVIGDHFVPASGPAEAEILKLTREWVKEQGISRYHEGEGICHIVPVERGYIKPGMMYVGGDSHSTTAGAVGAFAIALGSTDMLGVMATGQTWIKVPETILIEWAGQLAPYTMAKDMMLAAIGRLGGDGATYRAVEYAGEAVDALNMDERLVLSNMAIELGAKAGVIAPNDIVFDYLDERHVTGYEPVYSDEDAAYMEHHTFDASALEPLVARPHAPENVSLAREIEAERLPINQAYIGACTGAKYTDLKAAADVLKGQRVAPNVRLMVAPSSTRVMERAMQDGILATLLAAGATLLPSACGACAGLGLGVLASKERCISTTNRNFQGRMGARDAEVFLASPYTVAASAVTGYISDPRTVLDRIRMQKGESVHEG